jgi:CTP:molybdopterin cytidylyltransferase MocA
MRPEARVSAIVLAAGAGTRMGGPKALLLVDGEPLARVHARRLRDAGCAKVVIVTRPELVAAFAGDGTAVASTAPDPAGSLAVGLAVLASVDPEEILLVTPVDAWPARVETMTRLIERVVAGADAATPSYRGRGGHPVAIRMRALGGGEGAPRPLRDVLAALGEARVRVEVDDPAVTADLDTPEDVVAATGAAPRFA